MIIVVSASVFSSRWYLQNNLDSTKNILISSIRKSQAYAMSKKDNLTWGVCLIGQTIRFFGGTCNTPTVKDDYIFPTNVTITGLSTVTFSSFRGEPNTAQNITLSGNNKNFNLIINQSGGISVN